MNVQNIEVSHYMQSPKFDSLTAVAVARRIAVKSHYGATPRVVQALEDIKTYTEALQSVLKVRDRERPESLTPLEIEFDAAWRGLHLRLQGASQLRGHPKSVAAERMLARLFREGMAFIGHPNDKKWLESEKFLARIDEEGLTLEMEDLAGHEYLNAVRRVHVAFGDALGISHPAPKRIPRRAPVQENLQALSVAIGAYMRAHLGETDLSNPTSVAGFLEWMEPIDAARVARASKGEVSDEVVETESSEENEQASPLSPEGAFDVENAASPLGSEQRVHL